MRFKTWLVAALGLGSLMLLIVFSVVASAEKAQDIYTELDQLNTHHANVDARLRRLRSDVHLSGIFVRDYLLDVARERGPEYRDRLAEFRTTNIATVEDLLALAAPQAERILSLRDKLDEYWRTFDPLFDWTPAEKVFNSATFLRREVVPRREAVLAIAQEIEQLNNANHATQRAAVARKHATLRIDLNRLLAQTVLLGLAVSLAVVLRLRALERRSDEQRARSADAERQMRQLSQQLVATQEEERRNLSRELHDHVGQVLTALRMELGRIERRRGQADISLTTAIAECRHLVDDMFNTVRDLAQGLRPSMLDDFGLQPALEWHVRDFTSRYGLQVELRMQGEFDGLPDLHRTCVYRAVQEALTNCVRHAEARAITVSIVGTGTGVDVSVDDDGIGLEPGRRQRGLGLRGIEERVKELDGTMSIERPPGGGTRLAIRIPLPSVPREVTVARAAG